MMDDYILMRGSRDIEEHLVMSHWFVAQTAEENDTRLERGPMNIPRIRAELQMMQRVLLYLANGKKGT